VFLAPNAVVAVPVVSEFKNARICGAPVFQEKLRHRRAAHRGEAYSRVPRRRRDRAGVDARQRCPPLEQLHARLRPWQRPGTKGGTGYGLRAVGAEYRQPVQLRRKRAERHGAVGVSSGESIRTSKLLLVSVAGKTCVCACALTSVANSSNKIANMLRILVTKQREADNIIHDNSRATKYGGGCRTGGNAASRNGRSLSLVGHWASPNRWGKYQYC